MTQSTQVNDLVESCQLYVPCCIGHCLQISKSSFLEEKPALIFQVVAPEKSIKEVLIKPNQGAFCLMIHVEFKKKKKKNQGFVSVTWRTHSEMSKMI